MNIREIQQARAKVAREIARLTEAAETLRAQELQLAAMEDELRRRLTSVNTGSTVNSGMELSTAHKTAISAGRSRPGDKFLAHIQAVRTKAAPDGYSLRSLAAAIDISPATLRAHRLPTTDPNSRPCPMARAARVQELTSWPADARHWPAGLS